MSAPISKDAAAELAQHGDSRDHRSDRPQIVIVRCAPPRVSVMSKCSRRTTDPVTLAAQWLSSAQAARGDGGRPRCADQRAVEQTLRPAGLDWITALRAR
jgi:hypothetical protein